MRSASQHSWLSFLAPPRCVFCGGFSDATQICASCRATLPRIDSCCPRCALPTHNNETCGHCLAKPPPFAITLAVCRYAFPLDRLIQDFKYGKKLALAKPLGNLIGNAYAERYHERTPPGALIAMPLSRSRQIERGFNQAQEIARNLSKDLKIPLLDNTLLRTMDAPKQATLTWRERHKNVRNAFTCAESLAEKRIALIDDVMTSGATANAATRALLEAGAEQIDIWVVARTL